MSGLTSERVVQRPRVRVPQLARLVEAPRNDLVPERVVERDRVHYVLVPLQRVQLLARRGAPHLAGPVIRPRNKHRTTFVEGAVGEWQDVGPQDPEQNELPSVLLLLFLFLHKFQNKSTQVLPPVLG